MKSRKHVFKIMLGVGIVLASLTALGLWRLTESEAPKIAREAYIYILDMTTTSISGSGSTSTRQTIGRLVVVLGLANRSGLDRRSGGSQPK